jgi:hypothetical protein
METINKTTTNTLNYMVSVNINNVDPHYIGGVSDSFNTCIVSENIHLTSKPGFLWVITQWLEYIRFKMCHSYHSFC